MIDCNPFTNGKSGLKAPVQKLSKWKFSGASIPGRLHLQKDIPCQDRIYSLNDRDVNVISLSDGAGSCKYSHFGAEVVTQSICEIMANIFDDAYENDSQIKEKIIKNILQNLVKKASEIGTNIQELSSTLLFVAVKGNKYISGHIGDGVISYLFEDRIDILSHPDNGEYANSTYFVTSSDVKDHFRIYRGEIKNITGFILISDGTAERLYDKKNKKFSNAAKQILEWLDDNSSSDVSKALKNNLEKFFKEKILDDCSINLMKHVEKDIYELNNMPLDLQKEFLNSNNKIIIENRLKILNSVSSGKDLRTISTETGLSIRTIKKHVDYLVKDGKLKLCGSKVIMN